MAFVHVLLGLALIAGATGLGARMVRDFPRTPDPVRRQAEHAVQALRHPVQSARQAGPPAAKTAAHVWAEVRAQDWLERRQHRREHMPPPGPTLRQQAAAGVRARLFPSAPVAAGAPPVAPPAGAKPAAAQSPAPVATPAAVPPKPNAVPARASVPATAATATKERTQPVTITPQANGTVPASGRRIPPDHAALTARLASFEPGNHEELLRFIAGEANGMIAYAEALAAVVETCQTVTGLDPSSVTAVEQVAQITADAASAMTSAAGRFKAVYQAVIETVESGTLMPHRGRFFTPDGGS